MKTRRHAKILELIKEYDIDTQDELLRYLRESGFDVTQATVSRDNQGAAPGKDPLPLREVPLLHRQREQQRYVLENLYSLFADSVLSVEAAQNILVIRCMTGMAQAVCASLDAMRWQGFVGHPGRGRHHLHRLPYRRPTRPAPRRSSAS